VLASEAIMFPIAFAARQHRPDAPLKADDIADFDLYPDGDFAQARPAGASGRVTKNGCRYSARTLSRSTRPPDR